MIDALLADEVEEATSDGELEEDVDDARSEDELLLLAAIEEVDCPRSELELNVDDVDED